MADAEKNQICDNENCENELRGDQKRFCSQDCYHKQQSLEAKRRGNNPTGSNTLVDPDKQLDPREEKFCMLFVKSDDVSGNQTRAAIRAFGYDPEEDYEIAANKASKLMKKDAIRNHIRAILDDQALNDEFVDNQLAFLIAQHDDFNTKLKAIKEYNRLKERIGEETGADRPIFQLFKGVHEKADDIEQEQARDAEVTEDDDGDDE